MHWCSVRPGHATIRSSTARVWHIYNECGCFWLYPWCPFKKTRMEKNTLENTLELIITCDFLDNIICILNKICSITRIILNGINNTGASNKVSWIIKILHAGGSKNKKTTWSNKYLVIPYLTCHIIRLVAVHIGILKKIMLFLD